MEIQQEVKNPIPSQKIHSPQLDIQIFDDQQKFSQDQFTTDEKNQAPKVSFAISIIIVVKTVVGAGILGLPSVMGQWGWFIPTLLFIALGLATHQSSLLLLQSKRLSGRSNYSTLGRSTLDNNIFIFFIYFVFVFNNSGVCIAQAQIFGQSIIDILDSQDVASGPFYTQRWFVSLFLLLLTPVVLIRKIQGLKYLTVVGLFAILSFIILLFVDLGIKNKDRGFSPSKTFTFVHTKGFNFLNAFATVPNILLAFIYQMNFFPIYKGLQFPSPQRMQKLSAVGLLICFSIYFTVAIVGYATYGTDLLNTQGKARTDYIKVVTLFGSSTTIKVLMNVAFTINSFFTLPIIFFTGRNCLMGVAMLVTDIKKVPILLFRILTLCLFLLILIIAILVDSLGAVFNVIGSIASNFIGFIFPCTFFLVLNQRKQKNRGYNFIISIILLVLSLLLLVMGLISQF